MKMNSTFKVLAVVLMVAIVCLFLNDSVSENFLHASLAEDDSWFMRRFDKSVEPFLTGKKNLSMDAFDWWKASTESDLEVTYKHHSGQLSSANRFVFMYQQLQPLEEQTIDYYRAVVDSLLKTFPAISKGAERHGACAVVGNSANLKDSHYGRLIDIHDVVLRMNKSPIKGYEDDVGSKTTHRLMYPESATDLDNVTHLVLSPFKIMDMVWLQKALTTGFPGNTYEPVRSTIQANKNLVMVLNPAFIDYVHRMWLRRSAGYPSTGFLAVILALHVCEEVRVFGYGADSDGNWSHYWEKLRDPKLGTGLHYGKEEYDVIRKLAAQQKIHFFKMSSPKF